MLGTGTCASLTSSASHTIWELHLLFFSLANYSPEEAAAMLTRDIGAIPFPAYTVAPVLANLCVPIGRDPWHGHIDGEDGNDGDDGSSGDRGSHVAVPPMADRAQPSTVAVGTTSLSVLDLTQESSCDGTSTPASADLGTCVDMTAPLQSVQLLRQNFEDLSAAVQCSNALEWAVLHGDSEQAYQAMHEAATALLSATDSNTNFYLGSAASGASPRAAAPGCGERGTSGLVVLAQLLASKAKEWRVRVVICAVHLLERDQRWDDALHYLEILLGSSGQQEQQQRQDTISVEMPPTHTRAAAHQRGAVWVRYGIDLEHQNRYEQALKTYEQALVDPAVCGEWRVACARAYKRLWKPPRRWGSVRNCPTFATCPTFTLRGKRLPKVENRFGRISGGGWLPIRHVESVQPMVSDYDTAVDGSTTDGVWLQNSIAGSSDATAVAAAVSTAESASCSAPDCSTVAASSVEEYVRRHYLHHGFEGYHCENRLFLTLFGLLLWDVVHAGGCFAEQMCFSSHSSYRHRLQRLFTHRSRCCSFL